MSTTLEKPQWSVAGRATKRAEVSRRRFRVDRGPFQATQLTRASVALSREVALKTECVLEGYHGEVARCWVEIAGTRLPVDFPAAALSKLGLSEGARFLWTPRQGEIAPSDIGVTGTAADGNSHPDERLLEELEEFVKEREVGAWAEQPVKG